MFVGLRNTDWTQETEDLVKKIPHYDSCSSSLYRQRAKLLPPLPKTRQDLNLEGAWRQTTAGENFIVTDDDDMVILATADNLRHLSAADTWFCDGTFKSCPKLFSQLYTVHAFIDGDMFPLVYGLLPDKKEATYKKFFTAIQNASPVRLAPTRIFMDFESAAWNGVSSVFPGIEMKGCFFHYTQCIIRYSRESCKLAIAFKENAEVQKFVRRAAVLPLVPLDRLDDVWLYALDHRPSEVPDVDKFADYVTEHWVTRDGRSAWNHYETTGPRTTNHVEGWHHKVNNLVKSPHPNIYKLLTIIKNMQAKNETAIIQLEATGRRKYKKNKYRDLEEDMQNLKRRFQQGHMPVQTYADAASFHINF